jgi:hypothetical protein
MHRLSSAGLASLLLVGLLVAGCGGESQQPDTPPVLTGPTVTASEVNSGAAVTLAIAASALDGDTLTYTWTQTPASPAGVFSSSSVAGPTWTAPAVAADTTFLLEVTVTDSKGHASRAAVSLQVRPPPSHAPVLTEAPTGSSTSVEGSALVQLDARATDVDGDTLTYAWTQEPATPAGTFSSTSVANPVWTSPIVESTQRFTLKVTVSDSKGGTVQGQVEVEVAKPRPENRAPVVTAGPSASRDTAMANQSVSLSVSASDPDGDPLFYAWSQEPASPAGSFSSTSVANPTWTAPSVTAETTFQLQVQISDGKGGLVTRAVAVVVLAPVSGPTTTATSRGCTFTITAQAKPGTLPPQYDYVVARQASTSCSHAAATTTVGTSYTSQASITGNFLGIAVAYTTKNTASGSSPVSVYVKQLDPDTLSTVRQAMLTCGPSIYSVGYSNLFMPEGTTVQVDGSKGCTLYGYTETGSGSNYRAYFYDFFTTTNAPTVVAY